MKCEVYSCKFNKKSECKNIDKVIIAEGLDGLYCTEYKESIDYIKSKFHINKESITDLKNNDIVVVGKSYESSISYIDEIIEECKNKFKHEIKELYIDETLSVGTKNSGRFAKIILAEEKKDFQFIRITEGKEFENLKRVSSLFFHTNQELLENSILTSVQKKLFKKGLII